MFSRAPFDLPERAGYRRSLSASPKYAATKDVGRGTASAEGMLEPVTVIFLGQPGLACCFAADTASRHARSCVDAPCIVKRAPTFDTLKRKGGCVKLSVTRCIWIYMPHGNHVEVLGGTFNPGTSWLRPIPTVKTHMSTRLASCGNSLYGEIAGLGKRRAHRLPVNSQY